MLKISRFPHFWKSLLSGSCIALILSLTACAKIGDCYIEVQEAPAPPVQKPLSIHYFFKRNLSMAGYVNVNRNQETDYMRTLHSIYQTGEDIERNIPGSQSSLYEYGTISIDLLPQTETTDNATYVSRMIANRNPYNNNSGNTAYYGYGAQRERSFIRSGRDKPFASVSEYIFDELHVKNSGEGRNGLYIIVTNLLEQNNNTMVFHSFYKQAFEKGLSGAFFAIDSAFAGDVYRFNMTMPDRDEIPITRLREADRGTATFFILIVGSRNEVSRYSNELSTILNRQLAGPHHKVLFLVDPEKTPVWTPDAKTITGKGDYGRENYSMVNLTSRTNRQLRLFRWEMDTDQENSRYRSVEAGVTAYRMDTKLGSKYFAGLKADNIDRDHYEYQTKLFVEYSGVQPKLTAADLSEFREKNVSGLFTHEYFFRDELMAEAEKYANNPASLPAGLVNINDYDLFVSMEMMNRELEKGFYHVMYDITPAPVIPDWVTEKNVRNGEELRITTERDKVVKVEGLENIYKGIIDAYNQVPGREKYSVDFYLVKMK